jgi:hypothetical protein
LRRGFDFKDVFLLVTTVNRRKNALFLMTNPCAHPAAESRTTPRLPWYIEKEEKGDAGDEIYSMAEEITIGEMRENGPRFTKISSHVRRDVEFVCVSTHLHPIPLFQTPSLSKTQLGPGLGNSMGVAKQPPLIFVASIPHVAVLFLSVLSGRWG